MFNEAIQRAVLSAYHHAVSERARRRGACWPIVRLDCILADGRIVDTDAVFPKVVARWKIGLFGRVRVHLVKPKPPPGPSARPPPAPV